MRILEQTGLLVIVYTERSGSVRIISAREILGMVLLNLQLPPTYANHALPAMPDGRDRSSIAHACIDVFKQGGRP
jgi:hypothetical protein